MPLGKMEFWDNMAMFGTCPDHCPQLIAQNRYSKSFGLEPPPLIEVSLILSYNWQTKQIQKISQPPLNINIRFNVENVYHGISLKSKVVYLRW